VKSGDSKKFSFGLKRYPSSGARRLFVTQKPLLSPVFEPDSGRPGTSLKIA